MTEGLYWQSDVRQERFYEENRMYCGSSLIIRAAAGRYLSLIHL